ncbi:hypothetical protein DEA98_10800 [Brucella pseudogrignonensis]|nr:hypothetical protein [Brucella pseudogrignonensis]
MTKTDTPVRQFKFGPFDQITINGRHHTIFEPTPLGHILRLLSTGEHKFFSHEEIAALHSRGKLSVRKDYYTIEETFARTKSKVDHLFELSESDRGKDRIQVHRLSEIYAGEEKKGSRCLQQIVDDIQQELEGTSIGLNWAKANSNERKTMKPVEERDLQKSFSRKRQGGTPIVTSEKTTLGAVRRWLRTLRKGNYNPISLRDGRFRSGHGPKISQEICELLASARTLFPKRE